MLRDTLVALADAELKHTLAAFPDNADCDGAHFYHYYVPAYLAQRLVKSGVSPDLAILSAATFNLEYEIWRPALAISGQTNTVDALTPIVTQAFGASLDAKVREGSGRTPRRYDIHASRFGSRRRLPHLNPKQIDAIVAAV